jgi:glycosyltransferase involved in cell wall biosynthesis
MSTRNPLVTIGMPVFNGATTIAMALDSLLGQSFGDFEMIVSDNASTDGTLDIVSEYQRNDSRIRLARQSRNIGANPNWSFVARAANGTYLKWASSNDWCAPTFLSECVAALKQNDDATLSFPKTKLFSGDLQNATDYEADFGLTDDSPSERFKTLASRLALNNPMNGLIRLQALRQTRLVENFRGADLVLFGHLALLGEFLLVPSALFYRRMDPASSTHLMSREEVQRFHHPNPGSSALVPSWRYHLSLCRVAMTAPISLRERWRLLHYLAKMAYWSKDDLGREILEAARHIAGPASATPRT